MTDMNQSAGDVRLEQLYLTNFKGESLDISNFAVETTLRESMYSSCLFGECVIVDAVNILTKAPIIGRDTITIKWRTPSLEDLPENVIHKTFVVYAVTDRKLNNDREQYFVLKFMSIEGMTDNVTSLSQKFSGGTDSLASSIFQTYVSKGRVIGTDKGTSGQSELVQFDTPHNTNNFEFISNYWTPFKCLHYLAENSIGNEFKMPNVLFFETNKTFYFTSVTSLVQAQKKVNLLYDEYSYISNLDEGNDNISNRRNGKYSYSSPFISRKMNTVETIDYPVHFDTLKNQDSGYYGNVTYSYDYVNKDIYNIVFDYTDSHADRASQNKNVLPESFQTFKHITEQTPIVTEAITNPYAKINFKAGASGLFSDNDAFDIKQVAAVAFRDTSLAELDAVKYEIVVPGKTDIEVGRLIRFNYPNIGDKGKNPTYDDLFDDQISGIYIVTGILHTVDVTGHKMLLEIVRDSYGDK